MFENYWKVKDGLFIGDQEAAHDLEFLMEQKVSRVVNCSGYSVPNRWATIGISYLTYKWMDNETQVLLDEGDTVADEIYRFVEEALDRAEGVLIHSARGRGRSCCVLCAYLMRRYRWGKEKAMAFLSFRRPDPEVNAGFQGQLAAYELRLNALPGLRPLSIGPLADGDEAGEPEAEDYVSEMVLMNTYVNCNRPPPVAEQPKRPASSSRVQWVDAMADDRSLLEDVELHVATGCPVKRSALKGSVAKETDGAEEAQTIAIRRRSGTVHCRPEEIIPKRFGLQLKRRTLLLEYEVPRCNLRAHHTIRLQDSDLGGGVVDDKLDEKSDSVAACDIATAKRLREGTHGPWLASVSLNQIARLVGCIRLEDSKALA